MSRPDSGPAASPWKGGRAMTVVVYAPTPGWNFRWNFRGVWQWLNEEDAAMMDALEDILQALMYLGLVTLVFMFFGFMAETFLVAMNITDPNSLPIFGGVIGKLVSAMGTGASLVIVAFMMVLMIPMVVLFLRIGRTTAGAVRARD